MTYRLFRHRPGRGRGRQLRSARLLRCESLEARQLLTAVGGTDDLPLLAPDLLLVPTEAPTAQLAMSSPAFGSPPVGGAAPFGATSSDTSEYMLGDIWVNVVLLESDGSIDTQTEDWTQVEINEVKSEITEGAQWWENMLPSSLHDLSFNLDFTYADNPVSTRYEPITRSSGDQDLWIGDFLDAVGHNTGGSIFTDMRQWDHDTRIANGAHWAYTVFVIDSSNDADGKFDNGAFGYAYLGGPFTVLTYDNNGWGIDRMSHVFAHETGHIFYALDEYPDSGGVYTSRSGYYNTQNLNAYDGHPDQASRVNSLMAESTRQIRAWDQQTSSPTSLEMLGWQDSDSDGIFDVLDVPLSLTGSGQVNPILGQYEFTGSSSVQTLPNQNPYGAGHAITTNRVDRIQYRLDGGVWTDGNQYQDYSVNVAQNVSVPPGAHTIDFRTIVEPIGVTSPVWSDSFVLNAVQVTESDGSTDIREAGGVDTYAISLGTVPSGSVELTVSADSQSEVSLDGVTFGPSVVFTRNDTTTQTITVRAVDDVLQEGQHSSLITQAVTASADPNYSTSLVIDSVVANVTDNDVGGVDIVESDGSTDLSESGETTDTYTIALDAMPTATVVIAVTADSQSEVSLDGMTFSPAVSFAPTDTTPQTIIVRAIDDPVVEGLHTSHITHAIISSSDPNYPTAVPIAAVTATIADDDVADVIITQSDGTTLLSEVGTLDTYTIGLFSVPTGAVDITVETDGQSEVSLDGTTFRTSATVALSDLTLRTITVRAVDDRFAEGLHSSVITHTVTSTADPNYVSLPIDSIIAEIMDNDTAGITVTESDGTTNVSEAGGIDSYTINLDTPPLGAIVISVSGDTQTEVSLNGTLFRPNISFSRDSMSPQTIWVRAVDDQASEGAHVGVVTHSMIFTNDPAYPMALPIDAVVVHIADDDAAGVTVIQSSGSTDISEMGTFDTYTMALDTPPTGPVEITVSADSQAEVSLNGTTFTSSVTFTRFDTSPQTITVRAVDDLIDEGIHTAAISHAITASSAPNYPTTLPIAGLVATIADNDTAGITVTETGDNTLVSEAGTVDRYDIALDTVPVGALELTVTADAQTEVSLDGATFSSSLIFTRSDTSAQTITVRAVDDLVDEGDHTGQITQAITSSSDPNYPTTAAVATVVAQIADNDQPGITIAESDAATTLREAGGVDTYTLELDTPPAGQVEIQVAADGQSEVSLDGTTFSNSVTFLRNDMTTQTITVRAVDDATVEGVHASVISHNIVTSTAPDYPTTLSLPPVTAQIVDNELAGVSVTESDGGTALTESGATDSYMLALDVPPEAPIEITVTADPQSEVSLDGTTYSTTVSFSRGDTAPQTITLRALDDLVHEGPHTSLITQTVTASTDPNYPTTLAIDDVVANITDNDTAGVTVTETGSGTAIGEDGTTDSYSIALDTVPAGSVEITVTADDQSEVSLDGTTFSSTISFTRSDTTTQTLVVRAIDDADDEGPHTSVITHAVTASDDPNYPATLPIATVTADVTDNEKVGIRVKESEGSTDIREGGAVDSYTIALDVAPSGSVALNVVADAQSEVSLDGTIFRSSVSFVRTSTAAQTITVRALDDAAIEGPHTSRIHHSVIFSSDPNFPSGLAIPDVVANITDDEVAGVIVTESGASTDVTEAGNIDTYTIVLDTPPTGMVEITVTADGLSEVSLDGSSFASTVNFTPTDTTAQTITVRAVDNLVVDGPRTGLITNTVTASNDPQFPTNLPIADIVVNVADNDVAGVTIAESDGGTAIGEAGLLDTYTIALDTLPASMVEVTVTADDQSEVSLDGTTFSSSVHFEPSGTTPQTVTVRAVDDGVIEGDHSSTITHAITTSGNPDYPTALPIAAVVASIADNDVAGVTITESDGGTKIDEAGLLDTYTIALDTPPAWMVEITVTADNQSEVSLDGTTFSSGVQFEPSGTTPQTVTVRAVDDAVIEGDHTSTITHAITASADPDYSATLPIASVVATVLDNDTQLLGDVNSDGQVNGLDVDPFVDILLNGPYDSTADMNEDGAVNGLDVDLFVATIVGGSAPSQVTATAVTGSAPVMLQPAAPVARSATRATSLSAPRADHTAQRSVPLPRRLQPGARHEVARHRAARRAAARSHAAATPWESAVDHAFAADGDWIGE